MVFQKVLKGIKGITESDAQKILNEGIMCNWWRKVGRIYPFQIKDHLNSLNAELHLSHYNEPVPSSSTLSKIGGSTFGEVTPFISTTAGAIQRDKVAKNNILFPPFLTALKFATNNFKKDGCIFYAYLVTIGKVAIEMEQFSEEVRELHIYKDFLPYHSQGEIMAKIIIPSVQIEKVEFYEGKKALKELKAGILPTPKVIKNDDYQAPEKLSNVREVLS
jgi:hypothetical protein